MKAKASPYAEVGTSIDTAVGYLQKGQIVAFPTETYYGLAVDPYNESAVDRLYRLKNRGSDKPLLLLVENREQLQSVVLDVPALYEPFIEQFWPGPLTLIFDAADSINNKITGGTATVGVRISPHKMATALVTQMKGPVTATSANLSGQKPATSASEVVEIFKKEVSYVLDGGKSPAGLCSTILGISKNGELELIRKGQVKVQL